MVLNYMLSIIYHELHIKYPQYFIDLFWPLKALNLSRSSYFPSLLKRSLNPPPSPHHQYLELGYISLDTHKSTPALKSFIKNGVIFEFETIL